MTNEINFKKLIPVLDDVWTLYQSAITKYGVKAIADELKKSDKTIYSELSLSNLHIYVDSVENYNDRDGKPGYNPKLGLVDFIIGMEKTEDVSPLVAIASFFKMACFKLPDHDLGKSDVFQLLQDMNKEYTEGVNGTLEAMKDNKVSLEEARKNHKECMDIVNAASALGAVYAGVINEKSK